MFLTVEVKYDFKTNGIYTITVTSDDEVTAQDGTWEINYNNNTFTIDNETTEIIELTNDYFEIGLCEVIMSGLAEGGNFDVPSSYTIIFKPI